MDEILIPKLNSKKVTPSQIVKILQILSILSISNDHEEISAYFEETQVLDLVRELRSKEFIEKSKHFDKILNLINDLIN